MPSSNARRGPGSPHDELGALPLSSPVAGPFTSVVGGSTVLPGVVEKIPGGCSIPGPCSLPWSRDGG